MSPTTLAKLHAELSRLQRDSKQDSLAFDASVLLLFVWSAVHGALIGGGALLGGGALRGAGLALLGATATVVLAALLCGVFEGIGVRSSRLGLWLSWLVANALVQLYVAARAPWIAALVGPCAPLCLLVVERRVRRRAAQALEALV
ncbi:MAG: hypothetical protein KC503_36305, partial [Myxococcales bacterium]|nr:hypothetical protein [Myxococcales bacterium]